MKMAATSEEHRTRRTFRIDTDTPPPLLLRAGGSQGAVRYTNRKYEPKASDGRANRRRQCGVMAIR
jgi:hypothetical protein